MQCEVCGRRIVGKSFRATIEGAKMVVCGRCVGLSSASWELPPQRRVKGGVKSFSPRVVRKKLPQEPVQELEVVGDFGLRVRQGREKLGLGHEDLGRRIGEKVSVLRKVESGSLVPDHGLAGKLEHALRVKLLVPLSKSKVPSAHKLQPRGVTLGDVARVKKRKVEGDGERGRS